MRFLFFASFVFCCNILFAQDFDTTIVVEKNDTYRYDLQEVVVTGQLRETTIEKSIYKVKIVEKHKINSAIYNDVGELLDKSINIKLSQDNMLGSSVAIQGVSGRNVKILVDEVPVIGRLAGNIDLSQLSLLNIDRIEIIDGPMSTIYGSDALAGTINIVTKNSFNESYLLNAYYESVGKYNLDLQFNQKIKLNNFSYQFGRKYFNGWSEGQKYTFLPESQLADSNRVQQWKPKLQFFNKLSHSCIINKISMKNYVEFFNEKITSLGMPIPPYYENAFDEFYKTNRFNVGSEFKYKNTKGEMRVLASYNNYFRSKETIYKDLTNLSHIIVNNNEAEDTTMFDAILAKIVYSNFKFQNLKYQLALDMNFSSAKGGRIINNFKTQNDIASFLTLEYRPNDIISLRQSSRIIYNSSYNAPFIHSGNILFNFENYQIRASYGKGFRAPDFKELYLNFVDINHNIIGNENLTAETSNNYTFSNTIKGKVSKIYFAAIFDVYYNKINSKINLYEDPDYEGRYSYFNIDKFTSKGVSSSIKLSYNNAELTIGAAHSGTLSELIETIDDAGSWLFNTNYNISSFVKFTENSSFNLFYKFYGKSPYFSRAENEVVQNFSESYSLLDVSINRKLIQQRVNLVFGIKNIFDITNIKRKESANDIHSTSNGLISVGYGRSYFMKISYSL